MEVETCTYCNQPGDRLLIYGCLGLHVYAARTCLSCWATILEPVLGKNAQCPACHKPVTEWAIAYDSGLGYLSWKGYLGKAPAFTDRRLCYWDR